MKTSMLWLALCASALSTPVFATSIKAVLSLKEKVPMSKLAEQAQDPHSARYGVFYTPEEIRQIAAPSESEYEALKQQLLDMGFAVRFESKSHLLLSIEGEHTLFEKVFHTQINFSGKQFHTLAMNPQIPENLGLVRSIAGLDNSAQFAPHYTMVGPKSFGDQIPGWLPDDIKEFYGMSSLYSDGLSGKGQDIAIMTYGDFKMDDVTQFYQKIALSSVPTVDKVQFDGTPDYNAQYAGETELDAEFSGMIAPGANIHVFTSADNSEAGELVMYTAVLDDGRASVVNYSWGMCEASTTAQHRTDMDTVLARGIAQGVNFLVASGDTGSDGCRSAAASAGWPAAHPNIVSVGGSTLDDSTSGTVNETGWSGSGGGVSGFYAKPKWQSDFKKPFVKRSFPDIAFNADPNSGQAIWYSPSLTGSPYWTVVGGTSMAAPQWVGFLALVNEARANAGKAHLGFANPLLYGISSLKRGKVLHDITKGSNGAYKAGKGWDAVTGWGSMHGDELLEYLVKH